MTPESQRIAVAEACGWTLCHNTGGLPCGVPPGFIHEENSRQVPDYLNDLNAMHEAEKVLSAGQINTYLGHLYKYAKVATADSNPWEIIVARVAVHATAAQRAEAFLRTLNLWDDTK